MNSKSKSTLKDCVTHLSRTFLSPMDLLPHADFCEKCIDLVLNGEPENTDPEIAGHFNTLRQFLVDNRVEDTRVVVFGGGTGLSNIIGGDSRMESWARQPFTGLKTFFPKTKSIVCITDDGGSTGELLKDLPLIAIGDIRHVLLSSIQLPVLQRKFGLTFQEALETVDGVADLFNYRFKAGEISRETIEAVLQSVRKQLAAKIYSSLTGIVDTLLTDKRLENTLDRPHCLGNLIIAASIYSFIDHQHDNIKLEGCNDYMCEAITRGIENVARIIGANKQAAIPCTTTPAQLRFVYTNGVEATGECKSASATRGYPVERVIVDFSGEVKVSDQVLDHIREADIIIMAPGSLYSSIIPIFQVPELAESVRKNTRALKMLISNLWVQAGETDIAISDPDRKFHVSDMIRAYERNIPGGTRGLFKEVLCLSLKDVPGSILQNYALEGKIPIFLDKKIVCRQGFKPIECGIYSKKALAERGVIQHDPRILAQAVKIIYLSKTLVDDNTASKYQLKDTAPEIDATSLTKKSLYPSFKYRKLYDFIHRLPITSYPGDDEIVITEDKRLQILEIIWKHQDIPLTHLNNLKGIVFIGKSQWKREQKWDRVYSFFDPADGYIKIRIDQLHQSRNLEVALLIALGQSLLGNYAKAKSINNIIVNNLVVGKIYHLHLHHHIEIKSFFSSSELQKYLNLARMNISELDENHFTRVVNGNEGFTPPGVLMGLTYAWYLDNRLASHIEYKMALMKINKSALIPEQLKMMDRRIAIINFFRETVFSR